MSLRQKQSLFAINVAKLIQWAYAHGYEITLGEALRTKEQAEIYAAAGKGIKNSAHCNKLAIDLNLFRDGQYLSASADHDPLGQYWKTLHTENRWGGDFRNRDGNHYSMHHNGVA